MMEAGNGILQRIVGLERQLGSIEQQAAQRVGRLGAVESRIAVQEDRVENFRENVRDDFIEIKQDLREIKAEMNAQGKRRADDRTQIIRAAWAVSTFLLLAAIALAGILL